MKLNGCIILSMTCPHDQKAGLDIPRTPTKKA